MHSLLNVNGSEIEIPAPTNQQHDFHLFVDASVAELIVNHRHAITTRIYRKPDGPLSVGFSDKRPATMTSVKIWQLQPISSDRLTTYRRPALGSPKSASGTAKARNISRPFRVICPEVELRMLTLLADFKHGLRVLLKNPGFTAAAIIVLALGIGANTAIFSVVNAVLLRPLPFRDPARLVQFWHVPPPKSFPGMTDFAVSAANFIDWQQQNDVFDKMAIYTGSSLNLTGREQPEALQGAAVSADFFSTLQVQPMLGRTFTPDEDQQGKNHAVILTYGLWKSRFAANPNIAGQTVNFDGQPYIVDGSHGPKV